jgi:uncharacterized protein YndB with AHSA1/START domain
MAEAGEDRIDLTFAVQATPDTCWQVLTSPELIRQWWGGHVQLDARAGGRLEERWSHGDREVVTSGTVLVANAPQRLQLDWADDDWPGETLVEFRFSPVEAGATELRFSHSGWSMFEAERRSALMGAHRDGWSMYLKRFADLCSNEDGR